MNSKKRGKGEKTGAKVVVVGGAVEYIPARLEPHDSLADNSKARKLLGWVPKVSIEEGIAELKKLV